MGEYPPHLEVDRLGRTEGRAPPGSERQGIKGVRRHVEAVELSFAGDGRRVVLGIGVGDCASEMLATVTGVSPHVARVRLSQRVSANSFALTVCLPSGDDQAQFSGNPAPRDRGVDDRSRGFPGNVIDHVEGAEPPAMRELVMNEIDQPLWFPPYVQSRTIFPLEPLAMVSKPLLYSATGSRCVMTLRTSRPLSNMASILCQVSNISRP